MIKHSNRLNITSSSEDLFKTIGDVSAELNIPTHVLRFWEGKFSSIKPLKRKGGHRYYRPEDVEIITKIRNLLHDQGYTIKGAQKFLRNEKKNVTVLNKKAETVEESYEFNKNQGSLFGDSKSEKSKIKPEKVESFIKDLESVKDMLNSN